MELEAHLAVSRKLVLPPNLALKQATPQEELLKYVDDLAGFDLC